MLLVSGAGASAAPSAPVAWCDENQTFYEGECRPAPVCEPGCFPQAIMCRDRPVLKQYALPWAKFMDVEHKTVPMYNKRLDRGGLSQEHLAYIPDLNVTIGSQLSPNWSVVNWSVNLFIDEGSDRVLDRVYEFDISIRSAIALFFTELPGIVVAARTERDPLSYLYGSFSRFGDNVRKEPTKEHRVEYATMLLELERQMCTPSGW